MNIEWLKEEFDEANEICFFRRNADSRGTFEELKKIVEQAPSIDICFCEECMYANEEPIADGRYWCALHQCFMRFCSDGKRESGR